MALMNVDEYIERGFTPNSRPRKAKVWAWIRTGVIPKKYIQKFGKEYYIDESILSDKKTGNPLVDRVLNS